MSVSLSSRTDFVQSPIGAVPKQPVCPHCKQPLRTTTVTAKGKTYTGLPAYGSCGCEKSQEPPAAEYGMARCPECGGMARTGIDGISDCSYCGYSFVAKSVNDMRNSEMRRFLEAERVESMGGVMAAAGIPDMYRDVEPDAELASIVVRSGKGFFFQGGTGTYKTVKAASVARAYLDMGKSVVFVRSTDLVARFRDAMGGDESEESVLRGFRYADLLVIDDLGKEQDTEWAVSTIFRVVDARYGDRSPVVVTSNFTRQELAAKFASKGDVKTAEAIVSRLFEMTEKVDFGNEDARIGG